MNGLISFAAILSTIVLGEVTEPERIDLDKIASVVESYEKMFDHSEIIYEEQSRVLDDSYLSPRTFKKRDAVHTFIKQGSFRYVKDYSHGVSIDKSEHALTYESQFDGDRFVGLNSDKESGSETARLSNKFLLNQTSDYLTPYRLPFACQKFTPRMADYLRGAKGVADKMWYQDFEHEIASKSFDEIEGLKCVKIVSRIRRIAGPDFKPKQTLWISIERNYLPIRFEDYNMMGDETVPRAVVISSDIREFEPGVWIPHVVTHTEYNHIKYKTEKKLVKESIDTYTLKKLNLNPDYPKSFFQKIKVPAGASVTVQKGGEIVRQDRQGLAQPSQERNRSAFPRFWVTLVSAAFVIVIITVAFFKRKRRTGS
jgi:hypothetical protein